LCSEKVIFLGVGIKGPQGPPGPSGIKGPLGSQGKASRHFFKDYFITINI